MRFQLTLAVLAGVVVADFYIYASAPGTPLDKQFIGVGEVPDGDSKPYYFLTSEPEQAQYGFHSEGDYEFVSLLNPNGDTMGIGENYLLTNGEGMYIRQGKAEIVFGGELYACKGRDPEFPLDTNVIYGFEYFFPTISFLDPSDTVSVTSTDVTDTDATGSSTGDGSVDDITDAEPTDGAPTDGASTDGAPTDGTPTDGTPTDGAPTDGAPTDGTPTDGTPTDGVPTGGSPTDEIPPPSEAPPSETTPEIIVRKRADTWFDVPSLAAKFSACTPIVLYTLANLTDIEPPCTETACLPECTEHWCDTTPSPLPLPLPSCLTICKPCTDEICILICEQIVVCDGSTVSPEPGTPSTSDKEVPPKPTDSDCPGCPVVPCPTCVKTVTDWVITCPTETTITITTCPQVDVCSPHTLVLPPGTHTVTGTAVVPAPSSTSTVVTSRTTGSTAGTATGTTSPPAQTSQFEGAAPGVVSLLNSVLGAFVFLMLLW